MGRAAQRSWSGRTLEKKAEEILPIRDDITSLSCSRRIGTGTMELGILLQSLVNPGGWPDDRLYPEPGGCLIVRSHENEDDKLITFEARNRRAPQH
jgi:hypothetical protein